MSFETFKKSQLYYKRSPNLSKLGFDFENPNIEQEYQKIQSLLVSEYFIKNGSMLTIMKEFQIPSTRTMDILFREFEITSRSLSEATALSIETGRTDPLQNLHSFVHIWHTSWDEQKFLLRSSHEERFAKLLDEKKEKYFVEHMRIKYFDEESKVFRIAIPDFYLPNTRTIVEVKSEYWLDEQQMKCKKKAYEEMGYSFGLFLDGEWSAGWGSNPLCFRA